MRLFMSQYQTSDLTEAITLSLHVPILDAQADPDDGRRVRFIFPGGTKTQALLKDLKLGQLRVEPNEFLHGEKKIRSLIRSVRTI